MLKSCCAPAAALNPIRCLPEMVRPPRPADEGASKNVFKVALFKMIKKKASVRDRQVGFLTKQSSSAKTREKPKKEPRQLVRSPLGDDLFGCTFVSTQPDCSALNELQIGRSQQSY